MPTSWHLKEEDFFDGMPKEWSHFLELAVTRDLKKNDFVFLEGDEGEWAYYLESGAVQIFRSTITGRDMVFVVRRAGQLFGLAEVMGGRKRKCNAQALTESRIHQVERGRFERLLAEHPLLSRKVIQIMGRRIRYLSEQIENQMVCDVSTRLLKLFYYLICHQFGEAECCQGPMELPLKLTQEQIAAMTGSCQQTVSETMKKLQEDGFISVSKRKITLLDPMAVVDRLEESQDF